MRKRIDGVIVGEIGFSLARDDLAHSNQDQQNIEAFSSYLFIMFPHHVTQPNSKNDAMRLLSLPHPNLFHFCIEQARIQNREISIPSAVLQAKETHLLKEFLEGHELNDYLYGHLCNIFYALPEICLKHKLKLYMRR